MPYVASCLVIASLALSCNGVALHVRESMQSHAGKEKTGDANPNFMIVGGISGKQEMCLAVENGNVDAQGSEIVLEPCMAAVAAGDGRELWRLGSNGQIMNAVGSKCLGLKDNVVTDGGHVVLEDCDVAAGSKEGRSQWALQENNQITSGRPGQYCLSQRGSAPGVENVAAKAAAMASSSVNAIAHGANMAVDGRDATYWASKFDVSEPVTFTIDLGGPKKLQSASISWEFPAKSFAILTTEDGEHWTEVFSTDSNALKTTRVALPFQYATKTRLIMHEPHAIYGRFQGHTVYGIKSVSLYASRLRSIVDSCANAGKSVDARDKYFMSYVGEFDPCPSKALRSELPSLEAAKTSMASTVNEISDVLPFLASCREASTSSFRQTVRPDRPSTMNPVSHDDKRFRVADNRRGDSLSGLFVKEKLRMGGGSMVSASLRLGELIESQNGIDAESVALLMQEGRRAIIEARKALK